MTRHEVYTFEFPWFLVLQPPDLHFVCGTFDDKIALIAAESREKAKEIAFRHSTQSPPFAIAVKQLVDHVELLQFLRDYMRGSLPDKPIHVAIGKQKGGFGLLHIPTVITQLEEMHRPGPSTSTN